MMQILCGIISDLDGTLYRNDALQEEFSNAFVQFVARSLQQSVHAARASIRDRRSRMTAENRITPSEFEMLKSLALSPSKWLQYSTSAVDPEKYLSIDPDLVAAVREVKERAWIDVATNTARPLAERILNCIGIMPAVDTLWTPDDSGFSKPSRDLYTLISFTHSTAPEQILVLGDRWHIDLVGVKSLGMSGKLVDGPRGASTEMLDFIHQSKFKEQRSK